MIEQKKGDGEVVDEYLIANEKGEMVPNYDMAMVNFEEGDVLMGTVVKVDRDEVLVDVGYKSEGVILPKELAVRYNVNPQDVVKLNDKVEVLVLQKEDQGGRLILSKKRAETQRAYDHLEKIHRENGYVTGEVIEVVKGGLILDIGLRGFLPASLVDTRRVKNLRKFVGEKLECKIIEFNRARNNVVLSRKAYLEEERRETRQQVLASLTEGQVKKGVISNVVDFGAFVDLGGIDGLVHISELSWSHVNHPSEVVSIGDEVEVVILDVNRERERVSLGLKQTQQDPWAEIARQYSKGDIVKGQVSKLVSFGAFVDIGDGVEGLVHISELSEDHVEKPSQVVAVAEEVDVKIIDIDLDRRRIGLSMKQARVKEAESKEEEREQEEIQASGAENAEIEEGMKELKEEIKEAATRKYLDEEIAAARDLPEVTSSEMARDGKPISKKAARDLPEVTSSESGRGSQKDAYEAESREGAPKTQIKEDTVEAEAQKDASETETKEAAPQPEAQDAPVPYPTPAPDVKQAIPSTEPRETASATQEGKEGKEAKDKSLESVLEEMKKEARS
ncbi:small subunit ribosomal protein S1 [Candidatus Hakubella thermalkaliphila]|uniref:Small subunit ribosomal protein S1 n=2 Tax=Candidatus Hakubella thermalkaliphila TaxID=2754717 RepID=A0A6V8PU70_9ACTN|nr:30S ribosomal protein S1 [Candidatus Hakubella thermalkaliphila]GFP26636.1 small subunit ribosomal protein S1 [Candidatus Hakubella thermalkaliphila]GFP34566.1 small subunit ribosomal protein S1 [Candidatus Hakubella thermalkaliphila]GFP42462.1 small subunit ribosomal protein S1 [Candidatus Hakubella thermalkaliphila]